MTINLLIVEDHPLMQTAICATLESDPQVRILGTARSGRELFSLLKEKHANLVILDLSLPDTNGVEIIRTLHKNYPDLHILVFSSSMEARDVYESLQSGASGYLSKDAHSEELLSAVHEVGSGKAYLPAEISSILVNEMHQIKTEVCPSPGLNLLTRRERQILELLAEGLTNAQLAGKLRISEETVRTHLYNMQKKLPAENRSQLILFAAKHKTQENH